MNFNDLVSELGEDEAEETYLSDLHLDYLVELDKSGLKERNRLLDEYDAKWRLDTGLIPNLADKFEQMIHGGDRVAWIKWKGGNHAEARKRLSENRKRKSPTEE